MEGSHLSTPPPGSRSESVETNLYKSELELGTPGNAHIIKLTNKQTGEKFEIKVKAANRPHTELEDMAKIIQDRMQALIKGDLGGLSVPLDIKRIKAELEVTGGVNLRGIQVKKISEPFFSKLSKKFEQQRDPSVILQQICSIMTATPRPHNFSEQLISFMSQFKPPDPVDKETMRRFSDLLLTLNSEQLEGLKTYASAYNYRALTQLIENFRTSQSQPVVIIFTLMCDCIPILESKDPAVDEQAKNAYDRLSTLMDAFSKRDTHNISDEQHDAMRKCFFNLSESERKLMLEYAKSCTPLKNMLFQLI